MNLVVDDAIEVRLATKNEGEIRRNLGTFLTVKFQRSPLTDWIPGQILLKGDNVSLIQQVQ
jgi:small nuclear ribonucleoprotein E